MTGAEHNLERGVAVVSIDTEMAWGGAHRRGADAPAGEHSDERDVIERILGVFAEHEIAATWAIVGHLFLDHCERVDGEAHPEIVRPTYPWLTGDWFDVDPCSSRAYAPAYYAPDVIDAIRRCPVPQEIGCHSFSHAPVAGASAAAFGSDLDACRAVAAERGVELRSFVYPRNAIDHVALLGERGFRCYRGATVSGTAGPVGGLNGLVDRVRPVAQSAVRPVREAGGLWNIPQTYLLAPANRCRRLPIALWTRRPIARLRQAARVRSLFHLWFHPYNVTADPDRALRALDVICREAARLRAAGRLEVMTMGDLAARLDERLAC